MNTSTIQHLSSNPRQLFFWDGIGALASATLLGLVLPRFTDFFGMPAAALYILAIIPVFFMAYDALCYWFAAENWRPWLRGIAVMNLLYCVLSIYYLTQHWEALTIWGWIYFVGELVIIVLLVWVEWRTARW
ncbi:MAG: hypothetical protein AB8G22_06725 [Saprospiraceae bacterium]